MESNKVDDITWRGDADNEEYEIEEVDLDRDDGERGSWVVRLEYGFMLRWPRGDGSPKPKKGQTCRVFGDVDGEWGPRGVVVHQPDPSGNGTLSVAAYYRSLEDQVVWVKEQEAEVYKEAMVLFKEREGELRERLGLLPESLRVLVEAAREAADDKEQFDVYDLEVEIIKHEHGHMISLVVDTEATLDTFTRIPSQGQMGYSWNAMCDERIIVLGDMIKSADAPPDILTELRQDVEFLTRYKEQRFIVQHPVEVLREIFEVAFDILKTKISH